MKASIHILAVTVLAVVVSGANAVAAEWLQNSYLSGDLGVSLVSDVKARNMGGAKAGFEPGLAANINLGYRLTDSWAAEFETGVIWNSLDKIGAVSLSSMNANGDLYQIPFKVNLIYNVKTDSPWTPYIGAGMGGMASLLEGSARGTPVPVSTIIPIGNGNFSDTDVTFAYQAMAGLKYDLSDRAQVDLGYKFFGTLDHSWTDHGGTVKTDGIYTHAFLLSFTWKF